MPDSKGTSGEGRDQTDHDDDAVETTPATSGHSDAASQTQRNAEDESPG